MCQAGHDVGATASCHDRIVQTHSFPARENDERFTRERSPWNKLPFRKRMGGWNNYSKFLLAQQKRAQAERLMGQHGASDCGGQTAFCDHFPDAFWRPLFEVNRDQRIALSIFVQQPSEKWLRWRTDVAQAQFAFFSRRRASNALERFFKILQQQRRFTKQDSAGRSQSHMMRAAFQDAGAENQFHLLDGAAERVAQRAGDAPLLRNLILRPRLENI